MSNRIYVCLYFLPAPCLLAKPLVSRENLFYEAVEREAPPLLGYIPRYLGVMLVTYRRVKSSEHSPAGLDDRKARPVLHKANTITSIEPTSANNQLPLDASHITSGVIEVPESSVRGDDGDTETELPEVALDRNTHIVPHWLLRYNQADSRRHRAASMSQPDFPSEARSYLSPSAGPGAMARRFGNATVSTPDLAAQTWFCSQRSPLSRHVTLPSADPTPVNSPIMFGRQLNTTGGHDHRTSSAPPMTPSDFNPIAPKPVCGFGGTGSTTVNTKLKDHIFSTILRSMTKRRQLSAPGSATMSDSASTDKPSLTSKGKSWLVVEDHSAADSERESGRNRRERPLFTVSGLPPAKGTRSRDSLVEGLGTIRRTQSEDTVVGAERMKAMVELTKSNDPPSAEHGDVFHMELESTEEDVHLKQTLGSSFPPLARKRSRSGSIGPGPRVLVPPSLPSLAIPLHRSDSKAPVPPSRELPTHSVSSPANAEPSPMSAASSPRQNHFILMEDLTGRLKKPCVLDLKMGTRQYGMDATPGKKKSQRKKCDRTTSRALGVRVCGMQVSLAILLYTPNFGGFSVGRVAAPVLVFPQIASFPSPPLPFRLTYPPNTRSLTLTLRIRGVALIRCGTTLPSPT